MKKRYFLLTVLLVATAFALRGGNGSIVKETFVYAVKGDDTLRLDKYSAVGAAKSPCVIFVFGGGFFSGSRDDSRYMPYFGFLVEKGFSVVSIDYRLGFKMLLDSDLKDKKAGDFHAAFENSIYMAVEDLFDATDYVLSKAAEWGIDPETIISSGSSAGAITVLQGEYERCNGMERARVLPQGFRYAGVISFAGAVYSDNGKPEWTGDAAPVQLFHGDADRNVPYDKIRVLNKGFFGSKYIAGQYGKNRLPYYFQTTENVGHSIAITAMQSNLDEIGIFLDRYVLGGEPLTTDVTVVPLDKPAVKKRFGLKDFIKANTGR